MGKQEEEEGTLIKHGKVTQEPRKPTRPELIPVSVAWSN